MAKWVPFTAHVRVVPQWGSGELKSKRLEMWRDLEKLAMLVYDALDAESSIHIAEPGGGQASSHGGTAFGGKSGLQHATGVKPRIGQTPAQLQITGFYNSSLENIQPHPEKTIIHAGETLTGPGASPWNTNPQSQIDAEVVTLKGLLESAITGGLPGGTTYSIFRLDYSGIIYGDRGYHFP
jgi:hypothetical protein